MLAVVLSLAAAAANAIASVGQRWATREEPDHNGLLHRLWDLARRPAWVGGIVAMITGFGLESVALTLGRIALVEPLMIAELPLTLLLATAVFRGGLRGRAWLAIVGLAAGVAVLVFALNPSGGDPAGAPQTAWVVGTAVSVGVVVLLLLLGYRLRRPRAALLGVGTGTAFGLMSALVSGAGSHYAHGGLPLLLSSWQTYGALVVGPVSFFLLQYALQAGSLAASQPGFTLVNPLTAVLWGGLVFDEQLRGGVWLVVAGIAAVVITASTLLLLRTADASHGGAVRQPSDARAG